MDYIIKQNGKAVWPGVDISSPAQVYQIVNGGMGSSWEVFVADCATGQEAIDLSDQLHWSAVNARANESASKKAEQNKYLFDVLGSCPKCKGENPSVKTIEIQTKKDGRWGLVTHEYTYFHVVSCGSCDHSITSPGDQSNGWCMDKEKARQAFQGD